MEKNKDAWQEDAYKFSKQCLAAYTYHAAGQAKNLNLRVNCINPGITETRLSGNFRDLIGHESYDRITRLMGRAGKPEDVAGIAEFLTVGDAAWINGVPVARGNTRDGELDWSSTAPSSRPDIQAVEYATFDLGDYKGALRAGGNILALQGLNRSTSNRDFLLQVRMRGDESEILRPSGYYFRVRVVE